MVRLPPPWRTQQCSNAFKADLHLHDIQQGGPVAIHPRGTNMLQPAENGVHHVLQVPGRSWTVSTP